MLNGHTLRLGVYYHAGWGDESRVCMMAMKSSGGPALFKR